MTPASRDSGDIPVPPHSPVSAPGGGASVGLAIPTVHIMAAERNIGQLSLERPPSGPGNSSHPQSPVPGPAGPAGPTHRSR